MPAIWPVMNSVQGPILSGAVIKKKADGHWRSHPLCTTMPMCSMGRGPNAGNMLDSRRHTVCRSPSRKQPATQAAHETWWSHDTPVKHILDPGQGQFKGCLEVYRQSCQNQWTGVHSRETSLQVSLAGWRHKLRFSARRVTWHGTSTGHAPVMCIGA